MEWDEKKLLAKISNTETDELLDQVTAYRGGREGYALALIDMRATADHARILEYDNAHGYHHRHWQGSTESVEIMSYEDTEARFETEVRSWGKNGGRAARDIFQSDASERPSIGSWRAIDSGGHTVF